MSETQHIGPGDVAALEVAPENWPDGYDPLPDGWQWILVDVECGHCGAVNEIHEQPPQWLKVGVRWECTTCAGVNLLGGPPPKIPLEASVEALGVLECGECHATHDPSVTEHTVGTDGVEFTCPACGVDNRVILVPIGETGAGTTGVTA